MQHSFLILGCQRSGTTLLRLILETHPDIFCYDELTSYTVLEQELTVDRPDARLIGFKIPRWTEQLTRPVLVDEGLESVCKNFYKGEPILFLFRDVRDTISSMLKLKTGGTSWCETWVPRIIRAKLAQDMTFRADYSEEWKVVEASNKSLVALAALYWKYKSESFFSYRAQGYPVFAISYEQLVTHPATALQSVCRRLGIPFHEDLLKHHEFGHAEVFESGLTVGNTDPGEADSSGFSRAVAPVFLRRRSTTYRANHW